MVASESASRDETEMAPALSRAGIVAWRRDETGALTSFDVAGWAAIAGWDAATRKDADPLFATVVDEDARRVRAAHAEGDPPAGGLEYRVTGASGETRWVRSTWSPVRDGGRCGVEQDITEVRQAQAERHRAERVEMVARLSAGVAHDINNALTVVLASADVVSSGCDESESRELAGDIRGAALRAASLARQVLMFSRTGEQERRLVDVADTARGLQKLLRKLIGELADVEVEDGLPCFVEAEPNRVEQLIAGMVIASADERQDAVVRVRVTPDGLTGEDEPSGVRISVRRVGAESWGASPVDLAATCRMLGGELRGFDAASQECTAWLPAARRRRQPAPPAVARRPIAARVLIVDDDPSVRMVAATCLRGTGATIVQASHAHEALSLIQSGTCIDAMVADVMMPGMNGAELAARAREACPGLPILFISGFAPDHELISRLRASREPFLQKPFTAEEFRSQVAALASR
jgi:CheY-like chemotaxis protein